MANIIQFPVPIPVTNGNLPQFKFAIFGDNLATVTAAGYLNQANIAGGIPLSNADIIMALYSFNQQTQSGTFDILTVAINSATGLITLSEWNSSTGGSVTLPTIANHISYFTNATGNMSSAAGNIINSGNIQAGLSGTAGTLASFPSAASKGSLILAAVANTGNTNTTISNAAMGQASVISIPDPGGATADFALAPAALVNNNLIKASGTAGLIADSGLNASTIPTYTAPTIANHLAVFTNTTGNLSEDVATAINGGNLQAGLSGTAGTLISFPTTATNGSLIVAATDAGGAFNSTISNGIMGQSTTYKMPDPANAAAQFLVGATATPFISGNFPVASGTGGLMVDSGKSAAALPTFTSPTIANHLAVFTNTSGNLGEDAATAINAGNLQAGLSGTAGTLASFPSTAANGSLILAATNAGGAFNTTISNGTMAQSTVYTIPDVTAATGQFLAKTAAFVNGNLVQASGTAGVCVDSGVATSNVQLKTEVKAGTTANIGGAGAGPITVTVAGLTASSVVVATIATSSNTVAVAKAIAGSGNFDVTFTGDPGATCTLNYVAYIVSQ